MRPVDGPYDLTGVWIVMAGFAVSLVLYLVVEFLERRKRRQQIGGKMKPELAEVRNLQGELKSMIAEVFKLQEALSAERRRRMDAEKVRDLAREASTQDLALKRKAERNAQQLRNALYQYRNCRHACENCFCTETARAMLEAIEL